MLKQQVGVNIKLSIEEHFSLKIHCENLGVTMKKFIEDLLKKEIDKEINPKKKTYTME